MVETLSGKAARNDQPIYPLLRHPITLPPPRSMYVLPRAKLTQNTSDSRFICRTGRKKLQRFVLPHVSRFRKGCVRASEQAFELSLRLIDSRGGHPCTRCTRVCTRLACPSRLDSLFPPSLSFSRSTLRDLAKYVAWVEDGEEGRRNEGCYRGGRDLDPSYGEKGRKSIDLETMWKRDAKATTRWIRLCDKCEKRRGSPDLHATGRGRGRVFKVP